MQPATPWKQSIILVPRRFLRAFRFDARQEHAREAL